MMSELAKELLGKNIIDLNGKINQQVYENVRETIMQALANNGPDLRLFLTSCGGICQYGFAIYDLLACYPGQITGLVFNNADSMASIILQACDVRQCAPHATIIIHNPFDCEVSWEEYEFERKRRPRKKLLDLSRERMIAIYKQRTGRTRKQIERVMLQGKEMIAEEALKFGLVDEIIKVTKFK